MVLCRGERNCGFPIAEREEGGFLALQKFLHHHAGAGRAQSAAEHHIDRGFRLRHAGRDHHALTGGQPVGLDHDRRTLRAHVALGRFGRGEAFIGGGWNVVRLAKILGESLRAFELCRRPARPEGLDAGRGEIVDDTGAERRLGSDHHQINFLRLAERDHRAVVGGIERHQVAFACDAGIARRAEEPLHQRARRDFPGQRMLAPA